MPPLPTLPDDYYLTNFRKLTSHALEWYADLLTDEERRWLADFDRLSHGGQCLLVRLLSRRGNWFRSDKAEYKEIGDQQQALSELAALGFITLNPDADINTLAEKLLTKAEIIALFPTLPKQSRKEALLAQLSQQIIAKEIELPFSVIYLNQGEMIELLLVLFFANTHQDFSQFVLDDLGLNNFERYQLSRERRFFQDREQVEVLRKLTHIQSLYDLCPKPTPTELDEWQRLLPEPCEHPSIERKRQHVMNQLARDYERHQAFAPALMLYRQTQVMPTRERQARILDKQQQIQAMRDIVTEMLDAPLNHSELEVAEKLHQRVLRLQGQKVPRTIKPAHNTLHLELDLSQQRVELAVKSHFEQLGYQVYYLENQFLNTLFGLTFWDAIFAPVEGAFINRYQHRPLDLYHDDFVLKRHSYIESAIAELMNDGIKPLWLRWQNKFSIANPFVYWTDCDESLFELTEQSFPRALLINLFKVQLSDLKLYRNGMPDLILFKDGEFEWVEVKGPGDKLQDNQWRWIEQFSRLNVPFSVCYVNHTV
ncbi:VRR-NUC domain-containing protein [Vibrio fluvialis]|uniref:VRR-NUC domain-containing protein n=1 Tax=Vibrio fluvialis TaxID=676 RepID=UPI0013027CCE|nr:VRR-NUC domain-containing protein [Vibrio fluvialis]EKO3426693.1 VRR-NUC domain-containing protein [Vibrio fluvialis]EKO3989128.1 VRR-NUC domain-containing protein [Vibrio fluvialis]